MMWDIAWLVTPFADDDADDDHDDADDDHDDHGDGKKIESVNDVGHRPTHQWPCVTTLHINIANDDESSSMMMIS